MLLTRAAAALSLLALTSCSSEQAEPDLPLWTVALAEDGLAAAEASLAAQTEGDETAFLLGGVRFLRAAESIMQVRYNNYSGALPLVPGMRNTLPPNPDGQFDPAFVETAMTGALEHLAGAEAALDGAMDTDFAVEIALTDLWFDIDGDGVRSDWESLLAVMGELNGAPEEGFEGVVRFDTADAEWLKAYVHVMSGMAELTLSVDPTPAIRTVTEGRAKLESVGGVNESGFIPDDTWIDTAAAVLTTLRGVPDATRTRAAHGHFKKMIAHNRAFWTEVAAETDNDREWLPNAEQSSAFGIPVDADTAQGWQDVLLEVEQILDGEKLVPYWRVREEAGVGVNIKTLMESPGDMDLILWIQGAGAAPYLEKGELADLAAWQRFTQMTRGNSLLFAVWFN